MDLDARFSEATSMLGVSLKVLCERAGVSYKTLHSQIRNKRKIPVETIYAICHHWPLPLDYFSPYRAKTLVLSNQERPSRMEAIAIEAVERRIQQIRIEALERKPQFDTMDILDWVRRGGPEQSSGEGIMSHCDLFYPMGPEDNVPKPYSIGRNSKSASRFKVGSEDEYVRKVTDINPNVLEAIKQGHMEVRHKPYTITDVELRAKVEGCSIVFEAYCRFMATVRIANNLELTLLHAEIIPDAPKVPREQAEYLMPSLLNVH